MVYLLDLIMVFTIVLGRAINFYFGSIVQCLVFGKTFRANGLI